jgi:hypothetical protein
MHRFALFALLALLLGCARADFRNGYSPGDVETVNNAEVYHLADGVFVVERRNGRPCYYLIESSVADYELTAEGLDIVLEGEMAGTYSTTPAPQGYVAAWITEVEGEGPGVTRFQIEDATIGEFLEGIHSATTVRDVYRLRTYPKTGRVG